MSETLDERGGLPHASAWLRYELCAASFQLETQARAIGQMAYERPSPASDRGERSHLALEDKPVELSETEAATVDFIRERANGEIKRFFGTQEVTILKEKRLWLKNAGGHEVASGRVDQLTHNGSLALVQDWKTGWAPIDAPERKAQLKALAVFAGVNLEGITEVVTQIVTGPFGIYEERYGLAELSAAFDDVVGTLRKLAQPRAAFNPSPEACRWCPAIMICNAAKALIGPISKLQYSQLPGGERAAKLLDEVEILTRQLEQIRDYYRAKLLADPSYKIPGWALEQGAPRRAVEDWPAARARLEEFVPREQLDKLASFSIPAVERLLGKALGTKGARTKEELKRVLGDLLQEKFPAPSLKRHGNQMEEPL